LIVAEKSATFKNVATKDSHLDCRAPLTLIVALQEAQNPMKSEDTTKKMSKRKPVKHDWSRFNAMTEEERHAAALSDPDAQPLTDADFDRMKKTPRAKIIRRALGLSQEDFASKYHIPVGTLRDWEQGRCEPDQAAQSYLKVIAREPDVVRRALSPNP
jgi:putative transcriptional regulator